MENNQKFATFFSEASKGRKLGAVLSWLAAVVLIAALFVPAFQIKSGIYTEENGAANYDYTNITAAQVQSAAQQAVDKYADLSDADQAVWQGVLEGQSISLFSYMTKLSGTKAILTGSAQTASSTMGIVLLVVFAVLVVATVVCSLFTMNIISLFTTLAAVIEAVLVYFISFKGAADIISNVAGVFDVNGVNIAMTPAFNMILIVVLAAAAILQVVGIILHFAIHGENEDDGYDWDDTDSDARNQDTGLVDQGYGNSNSGAATGVNNTAKATAVIIQMNTGKAFNLPATGEVILGKGSQANIIVANPIISRTHAKIIARNGSYYVQDLDSKNGTFVGDQKLTGNMTVALTNGAYLTLGNEIFEFRA